jgi:UDP-glucose 4-epimerase
MERVLPLFIKRIAEDEPITVFGKEKVFDFTYVDDCITGLLLGIDALVAGRVGNQTINLAYGQGSTLVDAVNIIALALRKTPQVTFEPARPGEVMRYVADITKARQLLGYEPQTPLTAGIPKSIQWAREFSSSNHRHHDAGNNMPHARFLLDVIGRNPSSGFLPILICPVSK